MQRTSADRVVVFWILSSQTCNLSLPRNLLVEGLGVGGGGRDVGVTGSVSAVTLEGPMSSKRRYSTAAHATFQIDLWDG